jgi:hypothetical protein
MSHKWRDIRGNVPSVSSGLLLAHCLQYIADLSSSCSQRKQLETNWTWILGVVSNTVHFLGCLQCTLSVARRVICISQQAPAEIGDTYTFSFETVYACLLYTRYRCKKLKTPHKNVEAITDFSSIMLYPTVLYGTGTVQPNSNCDSQYL